MKCKTWLECVKHGIFFNESPTARNPSAVIKETLVQNFQIVIFSMIINIYNSQNKKSNCCVLTVYLPW